MVSIYFTFHIISLILQAIGATFTLAAYILLARLLKKDNPEDISFSSFMLWTILDSIAFLTIFIKGGFWFLPLAFVTGSGSIAYMLYKMGKISWGSLDFFIICLVAICIAVWARSGELNAIITATVATVLAGIPQVYKSWKSPDKRTTLIWLCFVAGNMFTYFASDATEYESFIRERFCPLGNILMPAAMVFISQRTRKR
jgi:hypothetical protein